MQMGGLERPPHSGGTIQTIEWDMMDKRKYIPLSMCSTFTVRCFLYPFTVIRTRLQVQKCNELYEGTFDGFRKIVRYEGVKGLYKGFWISSVQIVSGVFYVTTYENVRHLLQSNNIKDSKTRALAGGGMASLVAQTIVVPFDIISQHMMVLGQRKNESGRIVTMNPLNVRHEGRPRWEVALNIVKEVYRRDGVRGFYRGYLASLCTYVPNSAMWWPFYLFYQERLLNVAPSTVPLLMVQCIAAPLGGLTTTILTNPLDIVRARLQVSRVESVGNALRNLWKEEGILFVKKGLTARMFQSVIFSTAAICGYETIKRMSVSNEYRDLIRW